jgi:hypothetical protein
MNATTPTTALHPRRSASQAILAHQATQQHRDYTPAVLHALAHDQQRPPTTHAQRMLRDGPPPRGVRLTAATSPELAMDITGGPPAGSPTALVMPPLRASCCDAGWPGVDPAHRCPPHRQMRPRPRPLTAVGHPPSSEGVDVDLGLRAGQTGRDQLRFRAGVTRSTEGSEPKGDHQGRARSPPALVGLLPPRASQSVDAGDCAAPSPRGDPLRVRSSLSVPLGPRGDRE